MEKAGEVLRCAEILFDHFEFAGSLLAAGRGQPPRRREMSESKRAEGWEVEECGLINRAVRFVLTLKFCGAAPRSRRWR